MRWQEGLIVACIIDTDVCIDFLRKREYAGALFHAWMAKGLLAVSAVTHLEICAGLRKGEEKSTAEFLDNLVTVPVDEAVAAVAGNLILHLKHGGLTMAPMDAIIAATALAVNVPVITNNIDDYPVSQIPGLIVVKGLG